MSFFPTSSGTVLEHDFDVSPGMFGVPQASHERLDSIDPYLEPR